MRQRIPNRASCNETNKDTYHLLQQKTESISGAKNKQGQRLRQLWGQRKHLRPRSNKNTCGNETLGEGEGREGYGYNTALFRNDMFLLGKKCFWLDMICCHKSILPGICFFAGPLCFCREMQCVRSENDMVSCRNGSVRKLSKISLLRGQTDLLINTWLPTKPAVVTSIHVFLFSCLAQASYRILAHLKQIADDGSSRPSATSEGGYRILAHLKQIAAVGSSSPSATSEAYR